MSLELLEVHQSRSRIHLEELVDKVLGVLTCIDWEVEVSIQDLLEGQIFMGSLEWDCTIQKLEQDATKCPVIGLKADSAFA